MNHKHVLNALKQETGSSGGDAVAERVDAYRDYPIGASTIEFDCVRGLKRNIMGKSLRIIGLVFLMFLSAVSLTTCSDNSSVGVAGDEQPEILETTSQIITAQGGTITLPSGSSVSIPAGIFTTDRTVTLSLMSSLFKQPPSGIITGVGPALLLTFAPYQATTNNVNRPSRFVGLITTPSSGDLQFVVNLGNSSTVSGIVGSEPIANVVDSNGGNNFIGIPGDLSNKIATMTVPLSLVQKAQSIAVSLANFATQAITPSPSQRRVWNGSDWVDFPEGFNNNLRTLVLVHGVNSTVKEAFGCVNAIKDAGGYQQIVGFNYDWTQRPDSVGQLLADFINELGTTQIDIEAHSFGAIVALAAASKTNVEIKNMILEGGPLNGTPLASGTAMLTLLANYTGLGAVTPIVTTLNDAYNNGMLNVLLPGSSALEDIKTNALAEHPETKFIKVVGGVAPSFSGLVAEYLNGFLSGPGMPIVPTDGVVPSASASGIDLPGAIFTYSLSHTELQCDTNVIRDVGSNVNPSTPTSDTYTGPFSGTTTETIDCAQWKEDIYATITIAVSGSGTLIDPYSGSMNIEGSIIISLVYDYCDPNCDPGGTIALSGTGTVSGSQGKVEASASGIVGAAVYSASFTGGTFSGRTLVGTFTFNLEGEDAPIVKTIILMK
jgi:pimeloyl-ACP methyl ester carboxylesterase